MLLNKIDLNRLRVFYYSCALKSFALVAKELNVSRSAISQSLKSLEGEVGISLFVQKHREIIPSEAGKILFESIEPLFATINGTLEQLKIAKSRPYGRLRIGAPKVLGSHQLVNAIWQFRKEFPDVRFEITLDLPERILGQLLRNEIDFAIVDAGDTFAKLFPVATRPLAIEKQILVCSRGYFSSRSLKNAGYPTLIHCEFLSHVPDGLEVKFWFKKHMNRLPRDLKLALSINDTFALIRAALQGHGLALLPAYLIEKELKSGALVNIPTTKDAYQNQIMTAHLPEKVPSLAERKFLSFFSEFLGRAL